MFMGRIARVSPVLDPATRTAPIEIEIPNPGFRLKPGMYARVSITTDERKEALVVPENAVIDTGGRRGVFLLSEADVVSFRAVTVGIEAPEYIEILDGVADGDRVVTTGAAALRDGERVLLSGDEGASRDGAHAAAETQGNGSGRAGGRIGRGGRGANQ
jgi:RND family efflux transporter MFP subunit